MGNGRLRDRISASRGFRQRNPLFPFLFLLVVDVLGRMVSRGVERNVIEGFKVGKG